MFLDLGDESHGGVRACVHGGQDGDDHKEPGGGASGIHTRYHTVLLERDREREAEREKEREAEGQRDIRIYGSFGLSYLHPSLLFDVLNKD